MDNPIDPRRYDVDWIRVIAFGLLIPFHVAVGFVPWDVYPYQNNQLAGNIAQLLLLFIHQWRLPLLFLVSGIGTCFALKHRTRRQFFTERTMRLIIPLIFAMNFVIIFQGYHAALNKGNINSLTEFAFEWWRGFGEVSHLWFLINLFLYSLVCVPLFFNIRNNPDGKIMKTVKKIAGIPNGFGLLFIFPLPLIIVELFVKPWSYGVVGQGYELLWYLVFFILGYLCIATKDIFWNSLNTIRYSSLILGIICSTTLFILVSIGDSISPGYGSALMLNGGWTLFGDAFWGYLTFPTCIIHALNSWSWCMVMFSWGAKYLNKSSNKLTYLNQGVYLFYIMHLPITLVALFYIKDWEMFWFTKFLIINAVTVIGCFITFEILKRTRITRLLFGIKHSSKLKT